MMEKNFDELVLDLSTSSVFTNVLQSLSAFLKRQNNESLVVFVSNSNQSLLALEQWSWKLLSEDSLNWINESGYIDLFNALSSLNRSLIFDHDAIDINIKKRLLLPESIDQMNGIFRHIEQIDDDDSPYLMIINRIFENQACFFLEHLPCCKLPIIDYIGEYFVRNYIMNKQFKQYLWQLQKPQAAQMKITAKMLFYIKTCSFNFYVYLSTKYQDFFYPFDQMARYFGDDYLRIIHTHVPTIAQWNKEFMGCIAHLIALACRCCWWDGMTPSPMKVLLPTEQATSEHVQDLMSIIAHAPLYNEIKSERSNDETVLLESSLMFVLDIAELQTINWLFRSNESYQRILLNVAEIPANELICLAAYDIMSVVLADEQIKELKMNDGAAIFSFNILKKAWHDTGKLYKQVPIIYILQGEPQISFFCSNKVLSGHFSRCSKSSEE